MSNPTANKLERQQRWAVATTVGIILLVGAAFCFFLEKYLLAESRGQALQLAVHKAGYVQRQLDQGLSATHALAALLKRGKGRIGDFDEIAAEFLPHYPGLSALQLAPGGVIRHSVPLAGNERAIGHNLLTDERRNKEARLAMESGRLTLAGPFPLIQGGEAVVGRLPVYLSESPARFWGFAISLIHLSDFLAVVQFDELARSGYAYELWRTHPDSGERQVFARSPENLAGDPVVTSLEVPNGRWFLSLTPATGWLNAWRLMLEILLVLLLALAAGVALARHLRTQHALVRSEERYRALYEATPTMMHSIDAEGRIVSVSREWLETLGYAREQVIGRKSVDFLTEASRRHAASDVLPEFFRTGSCRNVHYQMQAGDGRLLDVLLSAYGERDAAGNIVRSLAVIQDITERLRAERRIHELLAEQRAIIENDLVGIVRVSERSVLWANPAFARMLGYAPGELDGQPTRMHYPDDESYRALGAAAYPTLAAGGVFHAQFELLRKDGDKVWLDVSGAMLDAQSGESLWAFVDVSELKQALNRVSRSEQRMELALAGADLGMWDWHIPSGAFICNQRMYEIIGYTPDELTLDNDIYTALICRSELPGIRTILFEHLHGESQMFEAEYRVRCKDDNWIWVLCRGRVVERDAQGRAVRMTGTNLDISERKASEAAIKVREARLANLISSMEDLVIVFDTGGTAIEYFYPPGGRHPYRCLTEPRGGLYVESLPEEIVRCFIEAIGEILIEARPRSFEYSLQLPDGLLISVVTLSPLYEKMPGFPSGFLAVVRDVTTERLYQQKIEALGRRNRLLLESVGEGIYGIDPDGRASFVNPAALDMLGLAEGELLGRTPHEVFHHHREDGQAYPAEACPICRTLADGQHRHSTDEYFWRRDGSGFPVALSVTPVIENGVRTGVVVTFQDITERRRAQQEIHDLAYLDPLTRLPNRRLLLDRLQQALSASKRSSQYGALFFIDLDNFKELNDSLGHAAGDVLLQQVAQRLLASVREVDTVARLGGDEFVLLLENLGQDQARAVGQAQQIGDKILHALNSEYVLPSGPYRSTPSIGVALFVGNVKSVEELLKEADIAMYQAKTAGRNTLRIFARTQAASSTAH